MPLHTERRQGACSEYSHPLVALSIAGSVAWAGQMTPALKAQPGPAGEAPAHPGAKAVEGKITSTDGFGKRVTLEDGTQLTIPDSLKAAREMFRP